MERQVKEQEMPTNEEYKVAHKRLKDLLHISKTFSSFADEYNEVQKKANEIAKAKIEEAGEEHEKKIKEHEHMTGVSKYNDTEIHELQRIVEDYQMMDSMEKAFTVEGDKLVRIGHRHSVEMMYLVDYYHGWWCIIICQSSINGVTTRYAMIERISHYEFTKEFVGMDKDDFRIALQRTAPQLLPLMNGNITIKALEGVGVSKMF